MRRTPAYMDPGRHVRMCGASRTYVFFWGAAEWPSHENKERVCRKWHILSLIRSVGTGEHSLYLLFKTSLPGLSPLPVAVSVIWPGLSVLCTTAVIMPLNTFICGRWKSSNEVGSPLAPAR